MQNNLFSRETYIDRRKKLRETIGSGQLIVLGNSESPKNFKDNWYPFRQDSSFLYYFGIAQAGLIGLIDCDSGIDHLFGDDSTLDDIVWTGPLPSLSSLGELVGVTSTHPFYAINQMVNADLKYLPPYRSDQVITLAELTGKSIAEIRHLEHTAFIKAVVEQRNIKSQEEITELHQASDISSTMHLAVMKATRPGMKEYELVAIAKQIAQAHHVDFSFLPIMTKDGQTLHNHYHGNMLSETDMVLFDGGCESARQYAGDMTRTFPVGKTFSTKQREIYDIVHSAFQAGVAALKPDELFLHVHLLAAEKLIEGLIDLGLMRGNPKEAAKAGAHTLFFQCGLGHMIGLDVHDMENLGEQYVGYTSDLVKSTEFGLKSLRLGRSLERGFAVTVEPGLYFIPNLIDQFKQQRKFEQYMNYDIIDQYRDFGGIRIENDYVITDVSSKLLGAPLATSAADIEAVRASA